jgi:hypothetical protein
MELLCHALSSPLYNLFLLTQSDPTLHTYLSTVSIPSSNRHEVQTITKAFTIILLDLFAGSIQQNIHCKTLIKQVWNGMVDLWKMLA